MTTTLVCLLAVATQAAHAEPKLRRAPPQGPDDRRSIAGKREARIGDPSGGGSPSRGPASTELARDVAVPARLDGHVLTIEARVNGRGPFRFAIDTGSGGMLRLGTALQDTLKLPQVGEVMSGDPSGKNMQKRVLVRVDSVEIGGAKFSGIEATVGNGRGSESVIGLALFAKLTAVLDYPTSELRLTKRPLAATDPHAVAFTTPHGVPVIEVAVAGAPMSVDVDSGSPATLTVPSAWADKLAFAAPPRVVGKGRTVSNQFEIRGAELRGELRVAGFAQAAPRVDIVDLFPVANLGSKFLRQYVVTFDVANRRMGLATVPRRSSEPRE